MLAAVGFSNEMKLFTFTPCEQVLAAVGFSNKTKKRMNKKKKSPTLSHL